MTYKASDSKTSNEARATLNKYRGGCRPLEHFNARAIDEAVSLLNNYLEESKIIAGGTDLIRLMKNDVTVPKVLVNIKTIPGLIGITEDADGLKIGALTTIKEIESSSIIRSKYTLIAEAAHSIASPHLRNIATIAGNLCQDVNCWYYRRSLDTGKSFICCRKGGEQCFALTGDNRYHAIFRGNRCFAVCPSDMAPALLALEAKVRITGSDGYREISPEELYTDLGNTIKSNEIITEIRVPIPRIGTEQRYMKFRLRKAIDFALSSVASVITMEDGVVKNARIALGGVALAPYRALEAEEALKGKVITKSLTERAARNSVSGACPLNMNAYKIPISIALVKRAIVGFI
ncbi:FAD binding domain-containing protein [Chloroflexota bacterium]